MKVRHVWWLVCASGCQSETGDRDLCSFPSEVAEGQGEATIDGDLWQGADVAWTESGSGLQITTGMSDGWRMTVVIRGEGLDEDGLGRISLDGTDGWALIYPESGSSYSSQTGEGSLDLVQNSDVVQACLEVEASGEDGSVVVEQAYLHAEALDIGG
jgi:hypothetical protein